ncbi:MAG TPA: hypothetical protein V6C58_06535 [Allocoleopsis sp.]
MAYTTLGLVQAEIRADTAFSSSTIPTASQVETWIDEVGRELEIISGNVFASTAVSSQYLDYDGDTIIRLPHYPIISVQKVEYNKNGNSLATDFEEWTEGFGNDFLLYSDEGELELIGSAKTPGKKRLRVSYTYGYTSTPLEVQRLATLMAAKRVIMSLQNSQGNSEGGDVQIGTIRVSEPSNYSANYIRNLDMELNTQIENLVSKYKTFRINRMYD